MLVWSFFITCFVGNDGYTSESFYVTPPCSTETVNPTDPEGVSREYRSVATNVFMTEGRSTFYFPLSQNPQVP